MRGYVRSVLTAVITLMLCAAVLGAQAFDPLQMNLGNLHMLSHAKTRSISPENFTGEPGKGGMAKVGEGSASHAARDLGQGWKVNPYVRVAPGETFTLGEIKGPGAIQHIWITLAGVYRYTILRMYWDGEKEPSVECPLGDFFCAGWRTSPWENFAQISSLPVQVNPGSGMNSYWVMPFREGAKLTIENVNTDTMTVYYQIDYTLTDVPKDAAYFHAQFRRINPLPYKDDYTIVDGIKGWGHYVGTYMAWQTNNNGWWGEGEIKFFMDGDSKFPTINGTGTEDYFLGSYNFGGTRDGEYNEFSNLYAGMPQVIRPTGPNNANQRFGLYRWHVMDPVRFEKDLKVTMQALGWRSGGRYLPLQDDIASVAYWYQREPHAKFPKLPDKDYLEVR
jgi:hypothetical protein